MARVSINCFFTDNEFSFIEKLNEQTYKYKKGNWTVNKPIIVDLTEVDGKIIANYVNE